jgi:hypothetical protein
MPLPSLSASSYNAGVFRKQPMAKRIASKSKFVVQTAPGSTTTIRDTETGETFVLKGYGALKGEYSVKKGIDLTKPIFAQTEKKKTKTAAATSPLSAAKRSARAKKR